MEECVKLEYAETAVPVKRRKIKGILPLLFAGSLVIVAADQGMNALRKPDLFRREHTVAEEKVKANRTLKHLFDMEEPVGKCVSLSETSTVKIPMEVSEDSEAAFLLETSIDWDSFPTGETGGMSGPDEAGEDTKTEEVIVVPDPLIPDKIPTGTENLPTTDIPLTDHPTVDPPLTDNPAVDRPTTDDPAADRPTADENDGSISGDTEEDTDLGEGGSSDSGVQDGNTDGDASETPGDGTADGDTADGDTADGGAENPAVPASPWVVDESGMLCKITPELLEIDDGVLYLPEGIFTGIRKDAFSGLSGGVYEIVLPSALTVIEKGALAKLTDLEWIEAGGSPVFASEDGVLFDAEMKEILAFPSGKTGAYIVPPTVERIAAGAFENSRLERLDLWECKMVEMDPGMFGAGDGNGMTIAVPGGSLAHYEPIFAGCGVQLI